MLIWATLRSTPYSTPIVRLEYLKNIMLRMLPTP